MSTEYKDENGNSPEVGGKLEINTYSRTIRGVLGDILFIADSHDDQDCEVRYLPKLMEKGFRFEPKPVKPKKPIPGNGIAIACIDNHGGKSVRISSGKTNDQGELLVYNGATFSGLCTGWPDEKWEML